MHYGMFHKAIQWPVFKGFCLHPPTYPFLALRAGLAGLGNETFPFRPLSIGPLALQARGLADCSSCFAVFSEEYDNHSSKMAAALNTKLTHSAPRLPTDQESIATIPKRNPTGRQTQAIRRVRFSMTVARRGLCFVLHHIGYRIPILRPKNTTTNSILSGERPTATRIAGKGRSAKTTKPNCAFIRRRCFSYSCQIESIGPTIAPPSSAYIDRSLVLPPCGSNK